MNRKPIQDYAAQLLICIALISLRPVHYWLEIKFSDQQATETNSHMQPCDLCDVIALLPAPLPGIPTAIPIEQDKAIVFIESKLEIIIHYLKRGPPALYLLIPDYTYNYSNLYFI